MANSSLDGFLQSFFVAACDVHFGSIALEGLGDDEAEARATFVQRSQYEMLTLFKQSSSETNLQ